MKITYTGNDLAREVPTMREPKADDYTDFLFVFPDSAYYLALEAYGRQLASLQTIPVLPGHNWIEGQIYEEGRDYWIRNYIENGYRAVLQPIVNDVAQKVFQIKELPEVGELDKKINTCVHNELHNQHYKEIQYKFWAAIEAIEKQYRGVNDVASTSKASPSLASHSCTEGNLFNNKTNSMNRQQAIEAMKQGKKVTHRYMSRDGWIAIRGNLVFTEEGYRIPEKEFWAYRTVDGWEDGYSLLNSEQNPERSVATPDPSSNEVDNK